MKRFFATAASLWNRCFLEERPSISLALFRFAVAFTVGAHIIPTLLHLEDNYLAGSFREKNPSFFTPEILVLVDKSPDWLVWVMTGLFYFFLTSFALGFFSQISCILLTAAAYFFYALNSLHIGTLSFDILLVTLFLMCVTGYHGDFFSLDALRRADPAAYCRRRPFFIQRLLQLQVASTFFYTALCKFTADGNWLRDNPIYYLLNSAPESVVKEFPFRSFFAQDPKLCYAMGVGLIACELSLPFLLFIRRTRGPAILAGWLFHVMLVVTLHVPTIFFFLFPPQLALFVEPEKIISWIERRRVANASRTRQRLIYDGNCRFCDTFVRRVQGLDLCAKIQTVNYQEVDNLTELDPSLNRDLCHSQIHLVTKKGKLLGGFEALRRLSWAFPCLWPLAIFLYLPGMKRLGGGLYRLVANNRYLFHLSRSCRENRCFR